MSVIQTAPLWLIGFGLFLVTFLCMDFGYRFRDWLEGRTSRDAPRHEGEGYLLSAALGLLALLFGFTFSLALDRYETRRELVLQEASSLKNVWHELRLLPEPQRGEAARLFTRYLDARIAWSESQNDDGHIVDLAPLQDAMFAATSGIPRDTAPEFLGPDMRGNLAHAFALAAARDEARTSRIPTRVILILMVYTALSSLLLGYTLQATGRHHRVGSTLLLALIALAFVLILDVDRPRSGGILISQKPMEDLARIVRQ